MKKKVNINFKDKKYNIFRFKLLFFSFNRENYSICNRNIIIIYSNSQIKSFHRYLVVVLPKVGKL